MFVLLGVAGSGKSTQSEMLARALDLHWISMGKLLRKYMSGELKADMDKGKMLDDTIVLEVLEKEMRKHKDRRIVLDGFPRRKSQAEWLLNEADKLGSPIQAVIHLTADLGVMQQRLAKRGRQDDNPEAIQERFEEFEKQLKPLLSLFVKNSIKVLEVEANGSPEQVHSNVIKRLKEAGTI